MLLATMFVGFCPLNQPFFHKITSFFSPQQDLLKQSHDSYKVLGEVAQKQAPRLAPAVLKAWNLQWTSENICVVKGGTIKLAGFLCVKEFGGSYFQLFRRTQITYFNFAKHGLDTSTVAG